MKRLFTFLTAVLITATIYAQAPNKFSYQAVVRNASGVLIQSSNVGIKISVLQGFTSGTVVYSETQVVATNANGLATMEIGGGTVVSGTFATIDWSAGPYFLKTEIDPAGGTTYTITGTSQLLSVPYALHAKTAENEFSGSYNDLSNKPALFDGTWTSLTGKPTGNNTGDMQYWNGTAWVMVPVGQPGQFLQITNSGIPSWSGASYPVLTTTSASSITTTTATSGGNLISDGGGTVTACGVCWNTSTNPTIANSKTTDGTGIGIFTSSITGLTQVTTYYVRAYATNSLGTTYGNEIGFTTPAVVLPTLTTWNASRNATAAASGGNISSDGGGEITARGVCWNVQPSIPTIADNKTTDGVGTGSFSSSITGLSLETSYYIRAYATNSAGTAYGNLMSLSPGIGASYQGGIVAYIFTPGEPGYISGESHGIIAATSDMSGQWGCSGTLISGAGGESIGTGMQNTTNIVNGCATAGIAAKLCDDLVLNGYSDWFLPSTSELEKLYIYSSSIGGFVSPSYWSSTQWTATEALTKNFINGYSYLENKSSSFAIRAIRIF